MPVVRPTAGPPTTAFPGGDEPSFATATTTRSPVQTGRAAPPDRGDADRRPVWGLTGSDRWLLTVSLAVMTALLTAHVWRDQQRHSTPAKVVHPHGQYQYQVALNSATWVEWAQLDGIGETLARRIVADREQHGPFRTINDLDRVKGIGPKTLEKMRPYVVVDEPAAR
jgi:competence protein ComEA